MLADTYKLDTTDTDIQSLYALALVAGGQEAQAHQLFGNDPSIFQTSEMAQAYMSLKEYPKGLAIYQAMAAAAPTDVNTQVELAQAQYQAGMIGAAVATMQALEKAHPEYATQIAATIKQIQAPK